MLRIELSPETSARLRSRTRKERGFLFFGSWSHRDCGGDRHFRQARGTRMFLHAWSPATAAWSPSFMSPKGLSPA